jgi:hypothetical protein
MSSSKAPANAHKTIAFPNVEPMLRIIIFIVFPPSVSSRIELSY